MKSRVRNLLMTICAVFTAVLMCLSVVCCEFMDNSSSASASSSSSIINVTDSLGSQLATSEFLDSDLLSSSQVKTNSDGTRRVIVQLESDSMLDVYLSDQSIQKRYSDLSDYINASEGRQYASTLTSEQSKFIKALSRSSIDYEIRHSYTSIINGISLIIDDDDVSILESLDGVKSVIYSESYAAPEAEVTINDVSVYGTGIYDSSDIDYSGEGIVVAVIDTGFDRSHSAFQIMPEVQSIKKSDISSKFNDLVASTYGATVTVDDVYYNEKVPFAYDYADGDADVFPKSNSHGLHVAGIIAGQDDSVTADDGEAFSDGETFRGVAPDAQLVICKVFPDLDDGTEGSAETDDILAALSDCITLGVDVINMSLGISAGFSREEDDSVVNEIYDKVYEAGINLVVAASNSGSSAQNGAYGSTNLTSNPDSGTVGSPSTYSSALSVASISGQMSSYMLLSDGTAIYFNESSTSSGDQGDFVAELLDGKDEATFNFVVVPGYGTSANYTPSVIAELSKGNCIAVISRGSTNFEEKQQIAFEYGAVACIIYNNVSGSISASLGTGKKIPTCTVTADIGQTLVSMGSGTIYLNKDYKAGPFMSDFSSWGPTSDLKIKPEITAHGGEITSSVVGGYSIYSGTSMASPNMAGAVALLRQHVSETYGLTGTELSDRVNQLLMSTATIINDERGLPYAVRRQGAGLGDISKAIATDAYLYVENNSKPKLELGDDPDKTGVYTMEFHVANMTNNTKQYTLDAIIMTESVSIDGITVAEQSYMLDDADVTYYVDGVKTSGSINLAANQDAVITVTIKLTSEQKDYLDSSFENGMYIEGFITLTDSDSSGVDLSIPYLAYYGDWLDAPVFDKTAYEVSSDEYNTAIADEDKAVAAIYESVVIGKYYKGTETYIPLGQYVYDTEDGEDSGIESMVDKIAVGNSDYGIYEFYAVYFGLLRSVDEMDVVITNSVTGEVVWSNTLNKVRKSYSSTPSYAEIAIQPYELGLQNNTQYTVTFTTQLEYNGRKSEVHTQEFTFYVDYEAPIVYETDTYVRFEYDSEDNTLRHAYLDLYLYDNHYVQSVQLFTYSEAGSDVDWATDDVGTVDWLTEYAIAVDSSRGAINKVTIEITDYLNNLISIEGETTKYIGVRIDDYALNGAAYLIPVEYPEVSAVDIQFTSGSDTLSLSGNTLVMTAGTAIDFTEDSGTVELASGEIYNGVSFDLKLYNYAIYSCSNCGFTYDEHVGYTYSAGDYYYDSAGGRVLQKASDDSSATYPAYTLFTDIIAYNEGTSSNVNYVTNHFVCPDCGTEATFSYNRRSGTLTPSNFTKLTGDAMSEEVIWTSSDESVVRVWNGRLYAVSEGTATITAYAPDSAQYPYPSDSDAYSTFTFYVRVEGEEVTPTVQSLSVGSYDNLTLGTSRLAASGSSISVDNGTTLVLYAEFNPWYVDSVSNLTWYSSNSNGLEILSSDNTQATVLCKQPGDYYITLQSGAYAGRFYISVGEEFTLYSTYFYEYNGPGYTETYTDPTTGEVSNILVVPADEGITNFGYVLSTREGPFYENTDIDIVVVPEGTTTIGLSCFENSSIRKIYLPSSLISIAYNAFAGCENLEGIYWYDASDDSTSGIVYDADNNTYNWEVFFANASTKMTSQSLSIGTESFRDCVRLTDIDLSGVTAIYDLAFEGCTALSGTIDLRNLRYSGTGVFMGCSNITGVQLDADTVLGAYMFYGTAIEEITYYGSYVGSAVFAGMSSLESITFEYAQTTSLLTTIGSRAFENCVSLKNVTFNRTFTEIGSYAFANCQSLEYIELPVGLTTIGNYAFQGCSSLAEVMLDSTSVLSYIGADVFLDCVSLAKITLDDTSENYNVVENGEYSMLTDKSGNAVLVPPTYPAGEVSLTVTIGTGMTKIGDSAYSNNLTLDGATLIISDSVKEIGDAAFAGTGIKTVIIPASVEVFGNDIFAYCENLETVIFLGNITEIPEGMFRGCTSLVSVQIPDSVVSIGDYAFEGTALKTLEIGRNVESIGDYAFADNAWLTDVTFASNSKLVSIGDGAFAGCVSLSTISLPDSVVSIGDYAFYGNSSLKYVYISASLTEMGSYAFANSPELTQVVFGDGATVVGDYAFVNIDNSSVGTMDYLASVTLPSTIKSIGQYAFAGNTVMSEIDLSGVETIGDYAFYNTTALTSVTLGKAASYIGISAFEGSAVSDIDLSGVEYFDARSFYGTAISNTDFTDAIEIGNSAFYNCTNITSLYLPNVEQIYAAAFYVPSQSDGGSSGSIRSITIGNKLIGLGGGAFFNSLIRTISLPASLEIIGTPAFAGCSALEIIEVDSANPVFFVDEVYGGLYKILANGTYELVAVPNGIVMNGTGSDMDPYVILDNTSRVGDWAMAYCENIHAVQIPASVKSIGAYAFYYMGMRLVTDSSVSGTLEREYYPKYIFLGLEAPTLETDYSGSEAAAFTSLYYNFSYMVGYLVNDMIIPANATGFDSVVYQYFFMNVEYSDEIAEDDTLALIEWLQSLDVDSLTLEDADTVTAMYRSYNMLTSGQKEFVSDYVDILNAAVAKINELGGNVETEDGTTEDQPSGDSNSALVWGIVGGVCVVIVVAAVVVILLIKRKKSSSVVDGEVQAEVVDMAEDNGAVTDNESDNPDANEEEGNE